MAGYYPRTNDCNIPNSYNSKNFGNHFSKFFNKMTTKTNDVSLSVKPKNEDLGSIEEQEQDLSRSASESDNKDPKQRYTAKQKGLYLFIISIACFLSPISTTMFLPAIPDIASDFNTTGTVINVSNSVYCVMMAISPCISSPVANIYGRRWTTIICSLGYTIGAFLTSASQNLAMFYIFRAMMAIFGTAFFSLGATVIGDIYIAVERGKAMGIILVGSQFGISISALAGGVLVHYTTWRVIFMILGGLGALVLVASFLFLPETGTDIKLFQYQKETGRKFKFYKINVLKVILITRYETVLLASLMCSTIMYNMYALLTPLRYVVDDRFNITSSIISALYYLPPGIGYLVGSLVGGKYSDYTVKYYIKKRGKRIPEDRLRASIFFFGGSLPISILLYGWSIEKRFGGNALPIIMMFINGFSQTMCFPSVNSYCIDSMPNMAGDSISNSYFLRFLWTAVASGSVLPSVNNIGIGWTSTISAFIIWFGFLCCIITLLYGEKLRRNRFPELFADKEDKT